MPLRDKDRQMRRRQRRVKKLRHYKAALREAPDLRTREKLIARIRKIDPWVELES